MALYIQVCVLLFITDLLKSKKKPENTSIYSYSSITFNNM